MNTTSLTDSQFEQLEQQLVLAGLHRKALYNDLLDHYYCLTTWHMDKGHPFEDASKLAYNELAPSGFKTIEQELQIFLNLHIHLRMNRILYSGAFLAAFGETMYILFRTLHWPGAAAMLIMACAALFFMVLPVWAIQYAQNRQNMVTQKRVRIMSGMLAITLFALGSSFKILHWPGANVQLLAATFLFGLVFFPLFFWEQYKQANQESQMKTEFA